MQKFNLMEELNNFPIIFIHSKMGVNVDKSKLKVAKQVLKSKIGGHEIIDVECFERTTLTIRTFIKNKNIVSSQENLENWIITFIPVINEIFNVNCSIKFPEAQPLVLTNLPLAFPVNVDMVEISQANKNISLKGIFNYVNCKGLRINFTKNIVSGGLGILKIKNISTLLFAVKEDPFSDALNIIKRHLSDKDILACQEELIDNGLKDYASL